MCLSPGKWSDQGYQLLSQFSYQRAYYHSACGDNLNYPPYYVEDATTWDGGMEIGNNMSNEPSEPQYEIVQAPGSTFTRDTNSAFTYQSAYSAFGASLTAQSGFSTDVKEG